MSAQQLKSKRWRAQVFDREQGTKISVSALLTPGEMDELGAENGTFARKDHAVAAVVKARPRLADRKKPTVAAWRERWITDPLFIGGLEDSTPVHRRERTKAFVEKYGDLRLTQIDDSVVCDWLTGGKMLGTVDVLTTMFNAAMTAEAGRLITFNPFSGIRYKRSRGNKFKQPPSEQEMWRLLDVAAELTPPSFADYLALGCMTALRPGELDALQWEHIRWDDERIDVVTQWNVKAGKFTTPKSKDGPLEAALVDPAREILERARAYRRKDVPYVFPTLRGGHYTPSTRSHHWNRVRCTAGVPQKTLYLCTRHFFGWYAYTVLGLPKEIVAAQLRHTDGGKLIEALYGHPDHGKRLDVMRARFAISRPDPTPPKDEMGERDTAACPALRLVEAAATGVESYDEAA